MRQAKMLPLGVGSPAPYFSLQDAPEQFVSLTDFRGQPVILLFYAADFDPISSDEVAIYNEVLPELQRHEAQVLGISVDSVWSHLAFMRDRNLHFPLLSDFQPKGKVARAYGVYDAVMGRSARAVYVVDHAGFIVWRTVAPNRTSPGADGALSAVERLDRALTLGLD